MNMYTEYDIATKNYDSLQSMSKAQLFEACKTFGLKGYSKQKKDELVKRVFEASNILRHDLLFNKKVSEEEREKREAIRRQLLEEEAKESRVINQYTVAKAYDNNPESSEAFVEYFWLLCANRYSPTTMAKQCKKDLKTCFELKEITDKIPEEYRLSVLAKWSDRVKPVNFARKEEEIKQNKNYAAGRDRKIIGNTREIISWATNELNKAIDGKARQNMLGLALSILSGRRQSEIFGRLTFESTQSGLKAIGLIKKPGDPETRHSCELVPLCDPELFLKGWQCLTKRGYEIKEVNKNISREISRYFPSELKSLGIEKYKDSRDFYTSVIYTLFREGLNLPEPLNFVISCMGHESSQSTGYYFKFQTDLVDELIPSAKNYVQAIIGHDL